MNLPTFLGIGTGRSGTRWLAQALGQHPDIYMYPDEVYFFNKRDIFSTWANGIDWYNNLFDDPVRQRHPHAWGEITPMYLSDPSSPALIHQTIPTVKLICTLRDQAEHHYSFYKLMLNLHPDLFLTNYSFAHYIANYSRVLHMGFYLEHIQEYLKCFAREQILVLLYEDLQADPKKYIQDIFRFLGVNDSFEPPSLKNVINKRDVVIHPKSLEIRNLVAYLQDRKFTKLAEWLKKKNTAYTQSEEFPLRHCMSPLTKSQIFTMYAEHNQQLGAFLGRNLDHWNT
jgi:hypothetical protein